MFCNWRGVVVEITGLAAGEGQKNPCEPPVLTVEIALLLSATQTVVEGVAS